MLLQYDLGLGQALIESPDVYNDGRWHAVQAKRHKQKGQLIIDGKRKYIYSQGTLAIKNGSVRNNLIKHEIQLSLKISQLLVSLISPYPHVEGHISVWQKC